MFEQMFDHAGPLIGLWPGQGPEDPVNEDALAYEVASREMADGWVEDHQHVLPDDLEAISPGPFLSALVSSIDPARLDGHDAVRLMKARARLVAHNEAGRYRAMAEVAFAPAVAPHCGVVRTSEEVEYAAVEIAAALTLTRRTSEREMTRAVSLSDGLRRVRERLDAGEIDLAKTRVLDDTLGHLPSEVVDPALDRVLDEAPGLTPGQLRARLCRLVLELDPYGGASSFQAGLADRGIAAYPNPDLTGTLAIHNADPSRIAAARAHIEAIARSLETPSEPRTLDQLRADVALDLLQGRCDHHPGTRPGGRVNLLVSIETLAGLSDDPGELEGYGPVIAEIARKVASENDGEMTYTVTDNGRPLATGTVSRRPTAAQRRHLEAVYPTCVMVGCRQPAYQCDMDHRSPRSDGGPTHTDNLEPLCRHHHMVRHHSPWHLERLPNGDHRWTSPLRHTYIRRRGPPP